MPLIPSDYKAPFLLRNGHLATIVPSTFRRVEGVNYTRERIETPDDDFLDLDWLRSGAQSLAVISHGLEGSARRPYVMGMAKYFHNKGWDVLAWNCRSCSGEINRQGRFYHHGETSDLRRVIEHALISNSYDTIVPVGFSMGGSMTIKYLGENGSSLPKEVKAGVAISVPVDLAASVKEFEKGSMAFYRNRFLKKLEDKVRRKAELYPDVIEYVDFSKIRYFPDFDNAYTAPLHGFADAADFYKRASAMNFILGVTVPLLLINARNDPFLTASCFPLEQAEQNRWFYLETPKRGGHVGFTLAGSEFNYMEKRAFNFVEESF